MKWNRVLGAVLALGSLIATVTPVGSQSRLIETVRGEVRKQRSDGRLIPGALLTVTLNPASGQVPIRSAVTGWDGLYYFQDVQPGSFVLTLTEKGKPTQKFRVDLLQLPTTDVPLIVLPAPLKDYRLVYANAIRAIDLEDWSGAAYILRQVLALHPENAKSRQELLQVLGNYKELYRPHFYLGLALQKLGDCDGALREWKAEEGLGQLKPAHRLEIQKGRSSCRVPAG